MIRTITVECTDCRGQGYIESTELFRGTRVPCGIHCQSCNGNGSVSFDWDCCDVCGDPCCCGECVTTPEPATAPVVYAGGIVEAPGFTTETFAAGVAKAQAAGYMQMVPVRGGVRVDTGKAGGVYIVTRTSCTCKGHQHAGHCYHRAACLYTHIVCGIDVSRETIVGFDLRGQPVTRRERTRQLTAVA